MAKKKYQKLKRECIKCGKMFTPAGKFCRICIDCQPRARGMIYRILQLQNKVDISKLSTQKLTSERKVKSVRNKLSQSKPKGL